MLGKIFLGLASVSITLNSQLPKKNAELIIVEEGPWHGKCSAIGIHANHFTQKVSNFICAVADHISSANHSAHVVIIFSSAKK